MNLEKKDVLDKLIIRRNTKKCFIFDLDGTIIFNDQKLCNEYESLLRKIHSAGHTIIFASGRPIRDFGLLMPEWTHGFNKALFGGGVSIKDRDIIRKNIIPRQNVIELIELCHRNNLPYVLDDHLNYYHPPGSKAMYDFIDISMIGAYKVDKLDKLLENDIYKLFVLEDRSIQIISEYAQTNFLEVHHHTKFTSFDVLPKGVNKFSGVADLFAEDKNDVFVFGDDLNDYPLFINFHNSILMGDNPLLDKVAKINIINDSMRYENLKCLIDAVLEA